MLLLNIALLLPIQHFGHQYNIVVTNIAMWLPETFYMANTYNMLGNIDLPTQSGVFQTKKMLNSFTF